MSQFVSDTSTVSQKVGHIEVKLGEHRTVAIVERVKDKARQE